MIGPKMKMSIAGKMSVPIGMSIFTGALATFSFELGLARCANLNAGIAQGLCHRGAKAQRADDAFNDPLEEGRIVAFCKRAQAFCAC